MTSVKSFTKNIGIVGLVNVSIAIERIILLPIITKLLGAEGYGVWSQIGVTISLLSPLVLLGLSYTLVRFLAGEKDKKEIQESIYSVLFFVFLTSLAAAAFFIFFANQISGFLGIPAVFNQVLGLIILFESLGLVFFGVLQAFQEIGKYSALLILKSLGEIILIIIALALGYSLVGAIISLLIIRVIIFLILFSYILKKVGFKMPRFHHLKEYLKFGLPTVVSGFSYWFITSSNRYLINYFLGIVFVGYFSAAYAIGSSLTFLIYPLSFLLPPVLSKFFTENNVEEVKKYLRYSLKYFLALAIPIVFGLSILSKKLLIVFSTGEIAENSYLITPFIVSSFLFYGIYTILVQVLVLVKKTRIFGTIWLICSILNVGASLILLPRFGVLAAAAIMLLSYIFSLLATWHYSSKEIRFVFEWDFVLKSILASTIMSLPVFLLNPSGIFHLVLVIVLGALIYGFLILALKGFKKRELEFAKNFFI
ncbi:MAG: oligosaccharide flippase family protein [Candidatus Pacebacteria bacterium]|nr:oligosaccharide flippase family protein [Candidatus Paceibacterota bacterium]